MNKTEGQLKYTDENGKSMILSLADFPVLKRANWKFFLTKPKRGTGYFAGTICGRSTFFHRAVFEHRGIEIPKHLQVDHINNDKNDNRFENLQLLSGSQNILKNQPVYNNKSGVPKLVKKLCRKKKYVKQWMSYFFKLCREGHKFQTPIRRSEEAALKDFEMLTAALKNGVNNYVRPDYPKNVNPTMRELNLPVRNKNGIAGVHSVFAKKKYHYFSVGFLRNGKHYYGGSSKNLEDAMVLAETLKQKMIAEGVW
jgi:hypothetical protein